jgi:hypothetical protein
VEFAARARALTGFMADAGALREAVGAVDQSDQPGDLGAALQLLESLQAGGGGEETEGGGGGGGPLRVYLLSDGGFGEGEARAVRGVELRHNRIGPESDEAGHDNLGIVGISARRDLEDPAVVRVFARVMNAGARAVETALELRLDGELSQIRPVSVPAATKDAAADGVWKAGETGATFELESGSGGLAVVSIARADVLASDDAAGVVLGPPRRARVLVVSPAGEADTFLTGVLEAMDLAGLRQADASRYAGLVRDEPGSRRGSVAENLARAWDLVIFDRVAPEEAPPVASISFGAGVPGPGGVAVTTLEAGEEFGSGHVVSWRRTHPVMRYVGLDQLIVSPPMRMKLRDDAKGVTVLALGPTGPLMALLEEEGRGGASGRIGRIVAAFELARSNWGPDVSFPVFVSNAVEYLTGRGQGAAGRWHTTTEAVTVVSAPGAAGIAATGPREVRVRVDEPGAGREVSLGLLDRAGVYRVTGVREEDAVVAVNLCDERESGLAAADVRVPGATVERSATGEKEGWREIWHWFVAAALLLLTVEWFVYAWRMRV